jgi:hypothetical protein
LPEHVGTVTSPPVRSIENILALLAAVLAGGAIYPWPFRLTCAIAAVGVLVVMIVNRYRARTKLVQKTRTVDTYAAVERLRAERKERFERNRPRRRDS